MAFWEDPSVKALSSGMDALWQKQQVISHNIANVETPGYKAKHVEFKEVLKKTEDGGRTRQRVQDSGICGRVHTGQGRWEQCPGGV